MFNKRNHILEETIKDFIQAITDTPEYQTFKKAQDSFNKDKDAKKLLADFQNTQQTCAVFRQGGFSGVEEQEKRLRQLQHRLQQNLKINELIKSQRNLQSLVFELTNQISQEINFPFAQSQGGGGCCG